SRLIATQASGQPAFGQYRPGAEPGTRKPWGPIVLEPDGDRIASWTSFLDTENLFPLFGLPPAITDR
ncbi:MAG: RNA polymerase subunit sigma-70, partial [Vicinamibacterales bacterium]